MTPTHSRAPTTSSTRRAPERTLTLYVRSLSSAGGGALQEAVITRLEQLTEDGTIAAFSVHVWGKEVRLTSAITRTDEGRFILDQVAKFHEWARRRNMSLDPLFETREVRSSITDDEYTTLTLPVMALAEYRGDSLQFVAPCTDDETVHTVNDRLDALETQQTGGTLPQQSAP